MIINTLGLRIALDEYKRRMKEGNLSLDEAKEILCGGLASYARSCAGAARSSRHESFAADFDMLANQIEIENRQRTNKISSDYENYDFLRVQMPTEEE